MPPDNSALCNHSQAAEVKASLYLYAVCSYIMAIIVRHSPFDLPPLLLPPGGRPGRTLRPGGLKGQAKGAPGSGCLPRARLKSRWFHSGCCVLLFPLSLCFVLTSPQTAAGVGRLLSGVGLLLCRSSWGTIAAKCTGKRTLGGKEKRLKAQSPGIPKQKALLLKPSPAAHSGTLRPGGLNGHAKSGHGPGCPAVSSPRN